MNRATFIAMGTVGSLPALPAIAQVPTKVRVAYGPAEEFVLPYYALQKGYFRAEGLDVDLTVVQGSNNIASAIIAGQLDLAVTNCGAISAAHVRGFPMALLGPCALYSKTQPSAHVVVAKTSTIRNAKDLTGKTFGLNTIRDMLQVATMDWVDQNEGNSASLKWTELPMQVMPVALSTGRIDASVIAEPIYTEHAQEVTAIGLPYASVNAGKPFATTAAIGNQQWVTANRAAAQAFTRALFRTADWANKNPAEVVPLLSTATRIPASAIMAYDRVMFATVNDQRLVQPVIDGMARYGFITRDFNVREMSGA